MDPIYIDLTSSHCRKCQSECLKPSPKHVRTRYIAARLAIAAPMDQSWLLYLRTPGIGLMAVVDPD